MFLYVLVEDMKDNLKLLFNSTDIFEPNIPKTVTSKSM